MNFNELAAAAPTVPAASQTPPPVPSTREEIAASLYAPKPPVKLDPVSAEVETYRNELGRGSIEHAFAGQRNELVAAFQEFDITAPPEVVEKQAIELSAIALDMEMSSDDVSMLSSLMKTAAINGRPDADVLEAGARESMNLLRQTYGKDATRVLEDTKRLVARDPRVKTLLERTGMGSNPKVVLRMAELSQQARSRGRLK